MASLESSASIPLAAARYHGDQAAEPGMLDFAVNVRHAQPPSGWWSGWPHGCPTWRDTRAPTTTCGDPGASPPGMAGPSDEVALLAGAAEGFALLPNLRPTLAAVIAPSFTEPDAALTAAGVPVRHVVLDPPFGLAGARVPDEADLVVVGNPTNPTAVLHTREQILSLRRPGRIVVVDEAFADAIPGEPESLADESLPDVVVLRSLTKTWSLAGLRVGYALGCAGGAGAADRHPSALAARHAATGRDRGMLRARRGCRSRGRRPAVGGDARGDGVRSAVGGCRGGRRPRAVRLVHSPAMPS